MSRLDTASIAALVSSTKARPPVQIIPFSAAPLYCASCLRVALWRGEADLALRCAYTLAIFDPPLLWKTIILCVLDDHATEAPTLLPLALSAAKAAKKIGRVWPIASVLVEQVGRSPKSRFFLGSARVLAHEFYAKDVHFRCSGFEPAHHRSFQAARDLFRVFWAASNGLVQCRHTPLPIALEALSADISWDRLDLAEAAWKATRSPSALALAALEPSGPVPAIQPAMVTTEIAFDHRTPRGRQWLAATPFQPTQLKNLSPTEQIDVFGEALWRLETESHLDLADPVSATVAFSLGGLSISSTKDLLSQIRSNLAPIRENRRTYLAHHIP